VALDAWFTETDIWINRNAFQDLSSVHVLVLRFVNNICFTLEPLAKLASAVDLLAEIAEKRRIPVLPGVKIGLPTKPKRIGK
jgi:hypothetical protein